MGLPDRNRRPDEGSRSYRRRHFKPRDDLVAEAVGRRSGVWKHQVDAVASGAAARPALQSGLT